MYFLTENLILPEHCHVIHGFLDDVIPFHEVFVIFYVSWYLFVAGSLIYSGIYQVIDEIEDDIVQSFESVLGDIDFRYELKNPYLIFERLTSVINTDIDFYGYLLSVQKNASLVTKVTAMVKEHTKKAILEQIEIDEDFADVILEYSITGMIAVYQQWFISGRRDSIGRLSDIINVLSFQGFTGALDEYNNNRFGIVQKKEVNHSSKDSL